MSYGDKIYVVYIMVCIRYALGTEGCPGRAKGWAGVAAAIC